MEAFLRFFEQMPAWQRLVWVTICLGIGWLLESFFPLIGPGYRKWRHAGVNSVFLATSAVINVLFGLMTVGVIAWGERHGLGLLGRVELPTWIELLIAVLLLDFVAQYLAHYLLHRLGWLWRFHVIHHNDTHVDATTGVRLHPGDYSVREAFALLGILVGGIPMAHYVVYRFVTVFFTFLSHANVAVPRWLDAPFSLVFVTPNVHKFHHHNQRPWTDRNFGGVFSLWDRLFGTFVYGDPRSVRYGLDSQEPGRDEDLLHQLALPFR